MKASPAKVPAFLCAWEHCVDLVSRQCQRLFHQHVLAGLGGLYRPFGMPGMGDRDIDRVDFGVGEEGLVAMNDPRFGKGLGKARAIWVPGGYGRQHAMLAGIDPAAKCLGDAARADNAPADFGVGHVFPRLPAGSLSGGPESAVQRHAFQLLLGPLISRLARLPKAYPDFGYADRAESKMDSRPFYEPRVNGVERVPTALQMFVTAPRLMRAGPLACPGRGQLHRARLGALPDGRA